MFEIDAKKRARASMLQRRSMAPVRLLNTELTSDTIDQAFRRSKSCPPVINGLEKIKMPEIRRTLSVEGGINANEVHHVRSIASKFVDLALRSDEAGLFSFHEKHAGSIPKANRGQCTKNSLHFSQSVWYRKPAACVSDHEA